jgi:uncharacterized protein (DUF885 family)
VTDDPTANPQASEASQALADLAAEAWEQYIAGHPIYATAVGDRRFDDRLRPNEPGAIEREAEVLAGLSRRADAIDPALLSPVDRTTRSALIDFLGNAVDLDSAGLETWAVDPLDGPQVEFLNIASFQSVRTTDEASALAARWQAMGPWLDSLIVTTRAASKRGVAAPQALVRSVVDELEDLLARPDSDWPLLDPGRSERPDWPADMVKRFGDDLATAVRDGIRPAFERYRAFLGEEIAPGARDDDRPGLGALPGGDEIYHRLVRSHTTLDLEPEAIHQIGLDETARIDAEFASLGARLLGTSNRTAILARLRSDPALHFATAGEVFAVAEASLARANAAIPEWFGRLPKAPCIVVEMAAHEAKHSTIAYYREPAADGSRPGSYYVNTTQPETRPRYEAEVLAFHEAVPGHHLQIAIAQELDGLPAFLRLAGPTAYVEGWGLYSERLSAEMGLLSGDMDRFGILSFDAWRACRLVVDTGLHAMGWSRDKAIRFMVEHTALAENNIANEVDRYLAMPGQALAYKLGQLEIVRLREAARTALGERFDIRSFHDAVLGHGALGLPTLADVIEDWIGERRAQTGRAAEPS